MPKITIYVPDDLKAKMDAAEKYEPNWSALAQEAFQLECGRITNRKRSKGKMDQVIERLRKSKENVANTDKVSGHAAGRDWAMKRAQYDELARVAALEMSGYPEHGWAWPVLLVIAGDEDAARNEYEEFWKNEAGNDEPSDDFVLAFAQGAEEVFNEVDDKL